MRLRDSERSCHRRRYSESAFLGLLSILVKVKYTRQTRSGRTVYFCGKRSGVCTVLLAGVPDATSDISVCLQVHVEQGARRFPAEILYEVSMYTATTG